MKTTRPTIISVAERAQVSKSLASRALRGDPGVSVESRRRVAEAAAELGYRLNSAARSLVRGESGIIGVVLNDIGNPHHTDVVLGVEAEAKRRGLRTVIGHGANSPEELERQVTTMMELRVDGIVLVSSWVPRDVLAQTGAELPAVVVAHLDDPPEEVDVVASDDVRGGMAACEHLAAVGCGRIAYVTRSGSATSHARRRGAEQAAQAAGLEVEVRCFEPGDAGGLRDLVAARRYDGILANNDLTAAELLRLAHEEGVRVPGELALIGYDDTFTARVLSPSLTSVDQPQHAMGTRAVRSVLERQAGRTDPVRAFYEPELVVRRSTARIPGGLDR